MKIIQFLFTLTFVTVFEIAVAQNFSNKHFTVADGLPGSEIYSIVQDNLGYLWLATNNGVSRFDGKEFKNFGIKDGLPSGSITNVFRDNNGRIWFGSYEGYLSCWEKNQIVPHPANRLISEASNMIFIDNVFTNKEGELVFTPNRKGAFKVTKDNKVKQISIPEKQSGRFAFCFFDTRNGIVWDRFEIPASTYKVRKKSELLYENGIYYLFVAQTFNDLSFKRSIWKIADDDYLLSLGNKVLHIRNFEIIEELEFKNRVISLFSDSKRNVWITTLDKGILMYPSGKLKEKPMILLPSSVCSKVIEDKSGIYWASTIGDGLFCFPSLDFVNFDTGFPYNQYIIKLDAKDNLLYMVTYDQSLLKANLSGNEPRISYFFKDQKRDKKVTDILIDPDGAFWVIGPGKIKYTKDGIPYEKPDTIEGAWSICQLNDNRKLITFLGGIAFVSNGEYQKFTINDYHHKVTSAYQDLDETIWLGTLKGLYKFRNDKFAYLGEIDSAYARRIVTIKGIKNFVAIGTYGAGLILKNNLNKFELTSERGINSDIINAIYLENENTIWLGTNLGLNKIVLQPSFHSKLLANMKIDKSDFQVTQFSINDGLPASGIYSLKKVDKFIWAATEYGLVKFDPKTLTKKIVVPTLEIKRVLINGVESEVLANYDLGNTTQSITIEFQSIDLRDHNNLQYYYQMKGIDDTLIITKSNTVTYSGIKGGVYVFSVYAEGLDKTGKKNLITINFSVEKKFSESALGIIIYFFIFLILAIGVGTVIILYNRKKMEIERSLMVSEQKSFRAQLNPHFLFNSLNSLQRYIFENNVDSADTYLTTFSSLLRRILENSRFYMISLYDSVETIKLYLQLEKMRFDDSFDFKINVDSAINLNQIEIPSMLIQPFVENAIWIGHSPKEKKGAIQVNFKIADENYLVCSIRSKISENVRQTVRANRKDPVVAGMKAVEERILLLNKMHKTTMRIETREIANESGNKSIIVVEMYIHYKLVS
jgi:ligand-binding sensor domain-containing protein